MHNPGDILSQRYRIEEQLGQGGFGTVYKARDRTNNRVCAVKENTENDPSARKQFEREASILKGLRHQNFPEVFNFFVEPNSQQYIVMEFVKGDNLRTLVQQQGALPESQVLGWMDQICDALAYLHHHNVIHRDVKHANIIITPTGRAVLVDLGIAKIYDPQNPLTPTTAGSRIGTPGFAPLEQYTGGTGPCSDVYAVGATLYFCLTGQVPPDALLRANVSPPTPLVPPRQLNPKISLDMEAFILKTMAMPKNDRYQTMQEVRGVLDAIQGGKPPPGTRFTGTIQQLGRPGLYSSGYSRRHYSFLLVTQTGTKMPCELKGYLLPLVLFNGASVTVDGAFDGNNVLQVTKLTDLQTQRGWTPKPTLGRWEQLKIELGLMKP